MSGNKRVEIQLEPIDHVDYSPKNAELNRVRIDNRDVCRPEDLFGGQIDRKHAVAMLVRKPVQFDDFAVGSSSHITIADALHDVRSAVRYL